MPLLTEHRYRDITGDRTTDPAEVTARIEEATDLIEGELGGRVLRSDTYTETHPIEWFCGTGYVYPYALPVLSVDPSVAYQVADTASIKYVAPDVVVGPSWGEVKNAVATVTYTGGYDETTCPPALAYAIANLANALACPVPIPVGASGPVTVGDVSVNIDRSGNGVDAIAPGLTARISRFRRRRRPGT